MKNAVVLFFSPMKPAAGVELPGARASKNRPVNGSAASGLSRPKGPAREKVGLKLNIQKTKIMASGPITSWQIDGETLKTVTDFIYWGAPKSLQVVIAVMKLKDAYSLKEKL